MATHLLLLIGASEVGERGDSDGVALVVRGTEPTKKIQVGDARVQVGPAHLRNRKHDHLKPIIGSVSSSVMGFCQV